MHNAWSPRLVLRPLVLSTLAALAAGCSAASGAPGDANATASTRAVPGAEVARVQAYLASRYAADAVRHSFHSTTGDDIDCTDFASEPGVRAMLAQGETLDSLLAPFQHDASERSPEKTAANVVAYFAGDRDELGQARVCPSGTVPHVRITAEDIAARGGLDAYLASFKKAGPPSGNDSRFHPESTVPTGEGYHQDSGSYAWVQNLFSDTNALTVQGGTSTMTIAAPSLTPTGGDHSVAQVWLTGADHVGQTRQTLEAGWIAVPGATTGSQPAHLFIFSTADAYVHGCFDGDGSSGCPTWIPNPGATLALWQTLPASTPGGTQHELTITISHLEYFCIALPCPTGFRGWGIWASVDGGGSTYLGYYTNASFAGSGTAGLEQSGDNFIMGGEVYDSAQQFGAPPGVQMGEGSLPMGIASYGYAAYHRDYSYTNASWAQVTAPTTVHYTNPEYIYNITAAPGSAAWSDYFYYGDWAYFHIIKGL